MCQLFQDNTRTTVETLSNMTITIILRQDEQQIF